MHGVHVKKGGPKAALDLQSRALHQNVNLPSSWTAREAASPPRPEPRALVGGLTVVVKTPRLPESLAPGAEVGMVKQVVSIRAHGKAESLSKSECLSQRHVGVEVSRTNELIAVLIAGRCWEWGRRFQGD